jgi:hypothetical protein
MEYPGGIDLTENWAEYHSKYDFSSGVFSAERRLVVKKDKVPLADWDKYLAFRRAIYGDEAQMMALVESGAVNGGVGASPGSELTDLREQIYYAIKTLNDVTAVLDANPPSDMRKVSGATSQCQELVYSAEAKSTELAPNSPNSLYWAQALAAAWTCRGWAELESRDIGVAEIYLRPAWRLSQSRMSGYELGRVLASEGKKAEAMHLFELASVADVSFFPGNDVVERHLADDYKTLTGKDLTTTALDHGQYNGSLRSELDNELEIRQLLHATKLTGSGLYAVAFENGKAVKVVFLGGDSGFASLVPVLQVHAFPPELPTGSKALLVREVRVICTPWAGCDAYLLLPNAIQMPQVPIQTTEITPPNAPKGRKTIRIENLPVAPTQ